MENSRVQYGSGRKRVSIGNIIGDPFALATISIAAVCTSQQSSHVSHGSHALGLSFGMLASQCILPQ
ncbi:hypothetical protein BR93DRAFT_927161 [Coniochaeta sp. PMI_546]|nr:hypothetical protein BR93DRAFT_927161 [Coniochaeta sp. PMI_546]